MTRAPLTLTLVMFMVASYGGTGVQWDGPRCQTGGSAKGIPKTGRAPVAWDSKHTSDSTPRAHAKRNWFVGPETPLNGGIVRTTQRRLICKQISKV